MAEEFTIKIYTPAGLVLEDKTSSVTVPSSRGQIGILPKHVRYTGILGTGILRYSSSEQGGSERRLVASGGFVNFLGDTLVILADNVVLPEQIKTASLDKERTELLEVIKVGNTLDPAWAVASEKLARIQAIEELAR